MRHRLILFFLLSAVALALVGCAPALAATESDNAVPAKTQTLRFEMAEDFTRFVFDANIVDEVGFPAHGSAFITQGYLYAEGTLGETDGINPDGSPEFPDAVIGTWICRGWIYGDPFATDGSPSAVTTQIFQLGEEYGNQTIITDGFEFMAPGSTFSRAIVGGTGEYRGARGEQTQEILGVNEYMGMAMRFELRLQK